MPQFDEQKYISFFSGARNRDMTGFVPFPPEIAILDLEH